MVDFMCLVKTGTVTIVARDLCKRFLQHMCIKSIHSPHSRRSTFIQCEWEQVKIVRKPVKYKYIIIFDRNTVKLSLWIFYGVLFSLLETAAHLSLKCLGFLRTHSEPESKPITLICTWCHGSLAVDTG